MNKEKKDKYETNMVNAFTKQRQSSSSVQRLY